MQKSNKTSLSLRDRLGLELQRMLSLSAFAFFGPAFEYMVFKKYRIGTEDLRSIRNKYQDILSNVEGPLLICSNHLTYVDSIIQAAFLNSTFGYLKNFKGMPWNLPERKNFYNKILWRIICYLGKCIPVNRGGTLIERNNFLNKVSYVLNKGDTLSIFPEGKRSRTGKLDHKDFSYGVGMILKNYSDSNVLCIYMRGKKHGSFCKYPQKNDQFHFDMKLIEPCSNLEGMKKAREISWQVIKQLKSMEEEYFANAN